MTPDQLDGIRIAIAALMAMAMLLWLLPNEPEANPRCPICWKRHPSTERCPK